MDEEYKANADALANALRSIFSKEPITLTYQVVRFDEGGWLYVASETGAHSSVHEMHFKDKKPELYQKFRMTTIGANIKSVELIEEVGNE